MIPSGLNFEQNFYYCVRVQAKEYIMITTVKKVAILQEPVKNNTRYWYHMMKKYGLVNCVIWCMLENFDLIIILHLFDISQS